ncbi:MAG: lipoate--protein ligase family protein [Halanaerobiaceae bacterium]
MSWRLLDTGKKNAFYNMAVDEAVLKARARDLIPPTIRFYQWVPPGLSLGYAQKASKVADVEYCQNNNIDIVRRLTGGRAILHDDELTYSLVIEEDNLGNILESYKVISKGIITGLKSLGLDAELKPLSKGKKAPRGVSAACFDAPSWYEVVVNGKKLVGSAQVRKKGILLQHGSIPFSLDVEILFNTLQMGSSKKRERIKNLFLQKATTIKQEEETEIGVDILKKALVSGWEKIFNNKIIPGELIEEEADMAAELITRKYGNNEWNFR